MTRSLITALAVCVSAAAQAQVRVTGDVGVSAADPFGAARATVRVHPSQRLAIEPLLRAAAGEREWYGLGGGRALLAFSGWETWVQVETGRFHEGVSPTAVLLASVGATVRRGGLTGQIGVTSGRMPNTRRTVVIMPDPIPLDTGGFVRPDSQVRTVGAAAREWYDFQAELGWRVGPVDARLAGGAQYPAGARARPWASAEGTWWLSENVALVAALSTAERTLLQAGPASGPVRLGMRMALGREKAPRPRAVFETRPVDEDHRIAALRVFLPAAQHVELTADFLDWRVVALERHADGMWEGRFALSSGSYRVNIRIDGGPWIVPPGLPAVTDEFSGNVGVLRIP